MNINRQTSANNQPTPVRATWPATPETTPTPECRARAPRTRSSLSMPVLNILNATRLFTVARAARSRVNTAIVVTNFIAGAIGSAAAGLLWSAGG